MNISKQYFEEFVNNNEQHINLILGGTLNIKKKEYLKVLENVNVEDIAMVLDRKVVHSGDEKQREVILMFYEYLLNNYNIDVCSKLKDKILINSPLLREIEIAKFLHSNPSREEIMDEFIINDRELRKELSDLKNGISLLNTEIKLNINNIESGKLECSSTVHPVLLPLNLTELYALLKYLPVILDSTNDPNKDVILDILDKIMPQLTNYAKEKLNISNLLVDRVAFHEEKELITKGKEWQIINAMKNGAECIFYLDDREVRGKIYNNNTIMTTSGEMINNVDFNSIDFVFSK